jgi:hypothetical protein
MPHKRNPNVRKFKVSVCPELQPIFASAGHAKRKYEPSIDTETYINKPQIR